MVTTLALSRVTGFLARTRIPRRLRPLVYKAFSKKYGVNLEEMEGNLKDFPSLHSFFTRKLKKEARPIDENPGSLVSPVDGEIISLGPVEKATLLEAKGARFTLPELLGNPLDKEEIDNPFHVTIYLCPGDYHRIHAPISGIVGSWWFVKGRLLPVNKPSINRYKNVFTGNRRIVSLWENHEKELKVIMVLIGALNVGAIKCLWDQEGRAEKNPGLQIRPSPARRFLKGEEAARFELGSTVILVFPGWDVKIADGIGTGKKVKVGQRLVLFNVSK